jgi:Peptidase S24-like
MSLENKNFLMLANTPDATRRWSAAGSALVAEALRGRGRLRLRVHGESMLPTLWPGEVVEIEGCPPEEVRPGEIVLARRDGRLFLHRLVAPCAPNGFRLRGDSMPGADPPYPPEALLGRLARRADVKWSRAVGMLLCHCGLARRLALKLYRWRASAIEFRNRERAVDRTSVDLDGANVGA